MYNYPNSLEDLIEQFRKLPSIGRKSAQRLALYMVSNKENKIDDFIHALYDAKNKIKKCEVCGNLTENHICDICANENRDDSILCIVEDVTNLLTIEKSESFKGKYHVLDGLINPSAMVSPDDIGVDKLLKRLDYSRVKEIIFAISPTVEGETTMLFLKELIKKYGIKTTRIASGIPVGGNLEYYDNITLAKAIEDRIDINY